METEKQRDKADCTVAICKCGRCVIMAVTQRISRETKKELGDAAADGCDIKHMPAEEVRKLDFGCRCGPEHGQLGLAL